eukprot:CAMPEP_0184491030 /NCGR_PEP_ID=MMETSP0113_2-20130426/19470_1 /TAXON_ID=91329 /ORGANISM="Norrisiella sphaerica, Strain BC52" /LENGTH=218 /DNA_ID=CAMNT_0026875215 /DNA_START=209 /DNA_END=865 /DNA_ORIENTATION=+
MFIFIAGNGPATWISLGISTLFILLPGHERLILVSLVVLAVAAIISYKLIPQVNQNETVRRWWAWLEHHFANLGLDHGGGGGNQQQNRPNFQGARATPSYQERFDAAVEKIKNLPIEEYKDPRKLHQEDVKSLRKRLEGRGMSHADCLEKKDLVQKLQEAGSSSETCAICTEEYEDGDLLRILPKCKHMFHIACIDKWLYQSSDYSRPVSCPMCNTQL